MGALVIKKRKEQRRLANEKAIRDRSIAEARRRRLADEDEKEEILDELTLEDLQALKELIPYKEALIKIAKGEFEIERIIEEDEEEDEVLGGEEEFEEDENFEEDEDFDFDEEDLEADDDYEEVETGDLEDSEAINDAWRKRLNNK